MKMSATSLSVQGLAVRGHTDEASNLLNQLQLRSEDCPQLKMSMESDIYKWYSHDICNKMLELMSHSVFKQLITCIKDAVYYVVIFSLDRQYTSTETLLACHLCSPKFLAYLSNCSGQCFDGASHMPGIYTGVQMRIPEIESRALSVHYLAHSLNLSVEKRVKHIIG
ncbi:hypothetical protein PR048_009087 [Dryococelus australis]|uniref:Uncharacterized protein n=1 Tax=Dryococelus australis TaxID=614101 RepID=A0ABQ9HYW5_9NEOP|nr:hypothetical protein PR048_009087 [Dryococelus australis]